MKTEFSTIYDRFLGKITEDMYMEISQEETLRDLRFLLMDALPGFEFPRFPIYDYEIVKDLSIYDGCYWGDIKPKEGSSWNTIKSVIMVKSEEEIKPTDDYYVVDDSYFNYDLSNEEINILAILMVRGWLIRQINSCEIVRMKYSGTDFKFTSQANHLSKLITLKDKIEQESLHMQRLYKRRKVTKKGEVSSNWSIFGQVSALE